MIRSSRSTLLAIAAVVGALAWPVGPSRADDTVDYVVKAGDTCYSIAAHEYGDRRALPLLHKLNPQLGPLPHKLVAGQVLKLPRHLSDPDAQLTGTSGKVQVRKPAVSLWDAARRGMDLFRAWRVGAQQRSSAEVTFHDDDRLQLRENTIVIIYGPERDRATTTPPQAVIEQGTLRSRLGELSPTVRVSTPTAIATLGTGSALVGVAADGGSTVANHEGKPVTLTGKVGGRVAVKPGMGTRVARGKPPEKPRPLPPPPAWVSAAPIGFAELAADGATVVAAWQPVATAAWYRLEVLAPSGTVVAAAEVPANVTRFELVRVPRGHYQARVSAIDVDRLEGRPGPLLAMTVLPVTIRPPGSSGVIVTDEIGVGSPDPTEGDARIDTGGPRPPLPSAARGATIGDLGLRCTIPGSDDLALARLTAVGPTTVRCTTTEGLALAPFTVDVTGVTVAADAGTDRVALVRGERRVATIALASAAPLGEHWKVEGEPGLNVDGITITGATLEVALRALADAPATSQLRVVDAAGGPPVASVAVLVSEPPVAAVPPPPPPRPPTPAWTAGGLLGWSRLPTGASGLALGDPEIPAYQLASGAAVGLRVARWFDRRLFAELEFGLLAADYAGAADSSWVAGGHAYLGVRIADSRSIQLRALIGGGTQVVPVADRYTRRDVEGDAAWGLTVAIPMGGRLSFRIDGRQHLAGARTGGVTQFVELSAGLESVLVWR